MARLFLIALPVLFVGLMIGCGGKKDPKPEDSDEKQSESSGDDGAGSGDSEPSDGDGNDSSGGSNDDQNSNSDNGNRGATTIGNGETLVSTSDDLDLGVEAWQSNGFFFDGDRQASEPVIVGLKLTGDFVDRAVALGEFKIDSAIDGRGDELELFNTVPDLGSDRPNADEGGFFRVERGATADPSGRQAATGLAIKIRFQKPEQRIASIGRLSASWLVKAPLAENIITISDISEANNADRENPHVIEHSRFSELGIESMESYVDGNNLVIRQTGGGEDAFAELQVFDPDGNPLVVFPGGHGFNDNYEHQLVMYDPPPDGCKLWIALGGDLETRSIPIVIENFPLDNSRDRFSD